MVFEDIDQMLKGLVANVVDNLERKDRDGTRAAVLQLLPFIEAGSKLVEEAAQILDMIGENELAQKVRNDLEPD